MVRNLKQIDLDEISLVDVPANQHAKVVLVKRVASESLPMYTDGVKPETEGETNKGEGAVTPEELTKKLENLQAQVTDLTKNLEAAEASVAALTKSAEAAGLDVVDGKIVKRADPEYVEIDGEKVEKSLVPAPVLKALEKAAEDIAKMQAKAEEVDLAKRGEAELPYLGGTALAKGRLLKSVGDDAELLAALKAADAAMKGNYEEKGENKTDDEMSTAKAKLEKLASDYAAEKNVSKEIAFAEVTKSGEGRALWSEMRNAQ